MNQFFFSTHAANTQYVVFNPYHSCGYYGAYAPSNLNGALLGVQVSSGGDKSLLYPQRGQRRPVLS